jgi:hypothetical protein
MQVKIADGDTFETIHEAVRLDDAIPDDDDRWFVNQALSLYGRCFVGGGAAPLFYLTPIKQEIRK